MYRKYEAIMVATFYIRFCEYNVNDMTRLVDD